MREPFVAHTARPMSTKHGSTCAVVAVDMLAVDPMAALFLVAAVAARVEAPAVSAAANVNKAASVVAVAVASAVAAGSLVGVVLLVGVALVIDDAVSLIGGTLVDLGVNVVLLIDGTLVANTHPWHSGGTLQFDDVFT